MSKVDMVRALVNQRLTAAAEEIFGLFERTIAEYEEELCRSKEKNERQQTLLDAVLKPDVQIRADIQQLGVSEEEVPPEQQEWSPSLDQEDPPEPPHIKEEQEELWTSQEGEQLQGLEEADITKFLLTPVPVKSEDDEEKPQSSQLHQRQTEQMETGADGEDCGGPEPARNSHPDPHLQPESEYQPEDSSETEDSNYYSNETREPQSGLNVREKNGRKTGGKPFYCIEFGKQFSQISNLKRHINIHTEEKPFSCSVCDEGFLQKVDLTHHMTCHTGKDLFSCSVRDARSSWIYQLENHQSVGPQSSQLHQRQTEQMETGADGEDCGGPEPARNSHPDPHLQPETEDSQEITELQSGLTFITNDEISTRDMRCNTAKKLFSCSICGKMSKRKADLKVHMVVHTGERKFICSVCGKGFTTSGNLALHMVTHTGEKRFSCMVCAKRFNRTNNLKEHMAIHTGEKRFSCSVCDQRFTWWKQLSNHKLVCTQSSQLQLHQN